MTSGLGCDGDTVAMTAATSPSLEDLLSARFPARPASSSTTRCSPTRRATTSCGLVRRRGRQARPVRARARGVGAERGDRTVTANGLRSASIPTAASRSDQRVARPAGAEGGSRAGTRDVRRLRRDSGDAQQPDRGDGAADYLGHDWRSRLGIPIVNLPGCPVQPNNITETLLQLVLHLVGIAPPLDLDEQGRPAWLFERTAHEHCDRAGYADSGRFSESYADEGGCLVELGCSGPVVKCNVPSRGWVNGIGGCPNVGRHLHGLHDAGLPRQVPAVHGPRTTRHGRRARRALHLWPGPALLQETQDRAQVRRRAGLAPPAEAACAL